MRERGNTSANTMSSQAKFEKQGVHEMQVLEQTIGPGEGSEENQDGDRAQRDQVEDRDATVAWFSLLLQVSKPLTTSPCQLIVVRECLLYPTLFQRSTRTLQRWLMHMKRWI